MNGTVLITGASRGLGYQLAREFALRHGAKRVLMVSKDGAELHAACTQLRRDMRAPAGAALEIHSYEADVTDPVQVERCADAAECLGGPIRMWINNVGYSGGFDVLRDRHPEAIVQVVDETLTSAALGCREAIRRRVPVVVNVAGGGSSGEACPTFAVYGACKRGIVGMTESLALEESETCFALAWPGMFKSRLLFDGMGQPARFIFEKLAARPEDVAADLAPALMELARAPRPGKGVRHVTRFLPTVKKLISVGQ